MPSTYLPSTSCVRRPFGAWLGVDRRVMAALALDVIWLQMLPTAFPVCILSIPTAGFP